LKVVAQGSLLQVFVDGAAAPSISLTDATYPKGSSGLRAYNSTAGWDNFKVSPIPTGPYLHLRLDETSGTVAPDSSGNGRNGTLVNGPTWTAGRLDNGVVLDGINDFVEFAPGVVSGLTDFTIAAWVRWDGGNDWQRIFDFGTGTNNYMFLIPRGGDGKSRFEITASAGGGVQTITAPTALPIGVWTHVAVSLSGTVGTYYINGVAVASNPSLTLRPVDLGITNRNYIGKSQFVSDPGYKGAMDDFQIHNRALTPARVASLAMPPSAPVGVTAIAGEGKITLNWNPVTGVDGYFVKRSTFIGGPYNVIAWQASGVAFVDSSVVVGTSYYYVITSSRSGAESARSGVVSAVPLTAEQAWRLTYFGTSDDSGNAADSADPDGDGNSNQVEFLAGTDPTLIGSAFVIASVAHSTSETKISFPSIAGRIYALERSDTLLTDSWSLVESAGIPQDAIVGTGAVIEVIDSGASAIPARFYRARVSR
jgi:Concanavalin A-like lectin/glucanases superfamily